jgi:hypothetical protein
MQPQSPTPHDQPVYVFVPKPRCPECGSARLTAYRTTQNSDGTTMRHVVCLECYAKCRVVLE